MKFRLFAAGWLCLVLATGPAGASTRAWTNVLGGTWFSPTGWSPNGVPGTSDTAVITNAGTYTVVITSNSVAVASLVVGGAGGTQTLVQGSSTALAVPTLADVRQHGVLVITNGGFTGHLQVDAGGEADLLPSSGLQLYSSTITNLGTVVWGQGSLSVGGSNNDTTSISNGGAWLITGDVVMNYGGGSRPVFVNSGTLRKQSGNGIAAFNGMDLINLPTGLVEPLSGTLRFLPFNTNILGGTFSIPAGTTIGLFGGNHTDAGGITTGTGSFIFSGGNFYLRTNPIPGLKFTAGEVYVNTNTFQQAGAITNLAIDGATLHGPNRVAGVLTFTGGNLVDRLTVLPGGQLVATGTGSKLLYGLTLLNQGLVSWDAGSMAVGGTFISNTGVWRMSSDDSLNYGGGLVPWFTNAGTIRKVAGTGTSGLGGCNVVNLAGSLVQVDTGTVGFGANYTNAIGELRLNGGSIQGAGGFTVAGSGLITGSGGVRQSTILGGTLSPGQGGAGAISFPDGLNLGAGAVLAVDGTGTLPGTQYDQLTVAGAGVALGGATLNVTSLPSVPAGTTFVLIRNTTVSPVSGTFAGLPENALMTISGQPFRIRYAGGAGRDVVLVRDTGVVNPLLSVDPHAYSNGTFTVSGLAGSTVGYTVLATTNFIQWTNIGRATSDPAGVLHFIDTNAAKFRYRFYRMTN